MYADSFGKRESTVSYLHTPNQGDLSSLLFIYFLPEIIKCFRSDMFSFVLFQLDIKFRIKALAV